MADAQPVASVPIAELLNVAAEYERAGRLAESERLAGYVLAAAPLHAPALHLAGILAFRQDRHQQAVSLIEQAIAHGDDIALYLRNISEVYRRLGRLDDALQAATTALCLTPDDPLCLHNLAVIRHHRLELDESLAAADRALSLDPKLAAAHFSRAEVLLLRGDWAEGWEEYEWRFRIGTPGGKGLPTGLPQWDGEPLPERRLLVVADQGFGDIVMFMRFLPWALQRCPHVTIACGPQMRPLLQFVAPNVPFVVQDEGAAGCDLFIPLSGLPRLQGIRPESVLWQGPYLQAGTDHRSGWAEKLDFLLPPGLRRVGLVWAGSAHHANDANRSADLAALHALGELSGIAFVSLQKGVAAREAGLWFGRAPLLHMGPSIAGFEDTMGILANLDLLISVDTSVAHVAGAMGCAVWLMLPQVPDWRWLLERDDTRWYPGHRLLRCDAAGWNGLVQHMCRPLARLGAQDRPPFEE